MHTRESPSWCPSVGLSSPVCLLHHILLHARERDEERARLCMRVRVCVSARARQGSQRGSYRMRNWWNAVPGQPTNTVGTVAWNEGHLGALTVKPPLRRCRANKAALIRTLTRIDFDSFPTFGNLSRVNESSMGSQRRLEFCREAEVASMSSNMKLNPN